MPRRRVSRPSSSISISSASATRPPPRSRWRSTTPCRTAGSTARCGSSRRASAPAPSAATASCGSTRRSSRSELMARRTAISAGWIVAFDGRGHRLLRDGVVVVEGERIVHVGRTLEGAADETLDARDRVLTPGLITTHAHIAGSPLDRSFIEDRGSPQFWYSGLFEMLPVRSEAQDEAASRACVDFSMAELLRGGVTTCMEIGAMGAYVVERAAHYGLRVYMGLTFRSGRWLTRDGKRVEWEWDEEAGRQGPARAVQFFEKHDGAHGGVVPRYFSPPQGHPCPPELLIEAKRRADATRRPVPLPHPPAVV